MAIAPGTRVGHFVIEAPLGAGGMGEVYKAHDAKLGRDVALKVLPAAFEADPDRLTRLEREARILASLNHPNIAHIYGLEETPALEPGQPATRALVMELVDGETLADRIARGQVPIADALPIARQICEALEAAHEHGVVHRDLKPANIKIRPDGTVKVLDFGLAKVGEPVASGDAVNSPTLSARATEQGLILGTAAYMSPEQASGKSVDRRTDLWAFGVVLLEMLTGRRVFAGESAAQVVAAVLTENPQWDRLPAATPAAVVRLLHRCLEKDPKRRLDSAAAARLEIEDPLSRGAVGLKDDAARPSGRTSASRRVRWRWLTVAAAVLLFGSGSLWLAGRRGERPSIAVLPFTNLSADKDQDVFSDGLSGELIDLLTHVKDLRVVGRTSSFAFKGKNDDIRAIARQLSVSSILEGSVQRSGGKLRVSTELVNAEDGYRIWAETYDRDLSDVFAVQDDIASQVVSALKVRLLPSDRPASSEHRTGSPAAYNEFLLGRQFYGEAAEKGYRLSVAAFERAIQLDPSYAAAYGGLARSLAQLGEFATDDSERQRIQDRALWAANRAVTLDPNLSEAYTARGNIRTYIGRDWIGAEEDFARALSLNPNEAQTHAFYARLLARLGRLPEAVSHARRATDLEPLWANAKNILGLYLCISGDTAEARKVLARAVEIAPANVYARFFLNETILVEGRPEEALANLPDRNSQFGAPIAAIALDRLGDHHAAEEILGRLVRQFGHNAAYHIALVYANRGATDEAFAWLERAYQQRDPQLPILKIDPLAAALRNDARFTAMLEKLNLPVK